MNDEPWPQRTKGVTAKPQGRDEKHDRHPTLSLSLEQENGDAPSILYGSLLGGPLFSPSHGIQMVIEAAHPKAWSAWKLGHWQVSIYGSNLKGIADHIKAGKQVYIRVGDNDADAGEDKPHVTRIEVAEMQLEGVAKGK